MIISAREVKRIRSPYVACATCGKAIIDECISIYGAAERGDRPYRIWVHHGCEGRDTGEEIRRLRARQAARMITPPQGQ